jgi:hypothetical protein
MAFSRRLPRRRTAEGPNKQKVGDFYAIGMDEAAIEKGTSRRSSPGSTRSTG